MTLFTFLHLHIPILIIFIEIYAKEIVVQRHKIVHNTAHVTGLLVLRTRNIKVIILWELAEYMVPASDGYYAATMLQAGLPRLHCDKDHAAAGEEMQVRSG